MNKDQNISTIIHLGFLKMHRTEREGYESHWIEYSGYHDPFNVWITIHKESKQFIAYLALYCAGTSHPDPEFTGNTEEEVLGLVLGYIYTIANNELDKIKALIS